MIKKKLIINQWLNSTLDLSQFTLAASITFSKQIIKVAIMDLLSKLPLVFSYNMDVDHLKSNQIS